jgi:microcin C transport system substrate-binding protein
MMKVLCFAVLAAAVLASGQEDDRFPPYDNTAEVEAFWKSKPEFFQFKTLADLPKNLQWETGEQLPELGDPAAKKGGTFHDYQPSFPGTLRMIGEGASVQFRSEHHDNITLGMVQRHLNVDGWVPALADAWAFSADKKTIYYKLCPTATFSNGDPVRVEDFMMTFFIMLSPHIQDPFYNDYYKKEYQAVTKYDEHTLSITIPEVKPDPLWFADVQPSNRRFFREFTNDFLGRYQWRKAPTTGAYDIAPEGIVKGRSITMHRVQDWWAKDRKHFRYRFNADFIHYVCMDSMDKAYELFRQGKLDGFLMNLPRYWYDKAEIPEIYDGYIQRQIFYNDYPRMGRMLCMNQGKPPLDNKDVRKGIAHALNFQKIIDVDFRGDVSRMKTTMAGFGKFSNPNVQPLEFDVAKARDCFGKAGFTQVGKDGVLVNGAGKRLSFTFTIAQGPMAPLALRLKEEALRAGLELVIEPMDFTQYIKKMDQKNCELVFRILGTSPPYPRFWELYHSVNAWKAGPDGKRVPVLDTNNVSMTADPAMDVLIDQQRAATNEADLQRLSWQLAEMVHEDASTIPAWESPFYRHGYWRWVKWPTGGNLKTSQLPLETHVHWLDPEVEAETRAAMREGRSFPETLEVFDQYRAQ